ncbi:MAG: DUF3618 domain-containing protein [Frankiaceae bacterium]
MADDRTDPDEIQREIERTRADLAGTIDAIADRVSPKRVAARTAERVRAAVKGDDRPSQVVVGSPDGAVAGRAPVQEVPGNPPTAVDRHESNARDTGLPGGGAGGSARYAVQRRLRTDRVLVAAGALTAVVIALILVRRRTRDDLDLDLDYQF